MLMVLPITAAGLDHHDIATLQGTATDPAKEII
jgi:hypothetical protein